MGVRVTEAVPITPWLPWRLQAFTLHPNPPLLGWKVGRCRIIPVPLAVYIISCLPSPPTLITISCRHLLHLHAALPRPATPSSQLSPSLLSLPLADLHSDPPSPPWRHLPSFCYSWSSPFAPASTFLSPSTTPCPGHARRGGIGVCRGSAGPVPQSRDQLPVFDAAVRFARPTPF